VLHDSQYNAGKTSLHAGEDDLNFSIDWLLRKASLEFYMNNNNAVAQFMYVELGIPALQIFDGYESANVQTLNWEYWKLSLYDVGAEDYVEVMAPETGVGANYIWRSDLSKYLDGNTFYDVNSEGATYWTLNSAVALASGIQGETKGRKYEGMANGTITYSNSLFHCLRRLGLAIKLQGEDEGDGAAAGASQVKVKAELFFI
jgi:hypothetical protein